MLTQEFFAFMRAREQIRLNRAAGLPRDEWTQDPILKEFKFTNVKRDHDYMSRYFLGKYREMNFFHSRYDKNTFEDGKLVRDWQDRCDLFMTCAIYRYFGTEKSAEVLGPYAWCRVDGRYNGEYFAEIRNYGLQGDLKFTGAYIIPNCGDIRPKYEVVADILEGIHKVHEQIVTAISSPDGDRSWRKAIEILTSCFGCGSFMAKEIVLDYIMATGELPTDWQSWTPIGPGARRGAARVLSADGSLDRPLSEPKALQVAKDLYDAYRQQPLPGEPHPLWPEEWVLLDLSDIQFQLCEFDKYYRAKLGEGRPKARFTPRG